MSHHILTECEISEYQYSTFAMSSDINTVFSFDQILLSFLGIKSSFIRKKMDEILLTCFSRVT